MKSNLVCLTCKWWMRSDDKSIGVCRLCNEYRFQYEVCAKWDYAEQRIPYSDSEEQRELKNKQREDEIEKLIRQGKTITETGKKLHCSYYTVKEVIDERKLEVKRGKPRPYQRVIDDKQLKEVVSYRKDGMFISSIAERMGVSCGAIKNALKRAES